MLRAFVKKFRIAKTPLGAFVITALAQQYFHPHIFLMFMPKTIDLMTVAAGRIHKKTQDANQ